MDSDPERLLVPRVRQQAVAGLVFDADFDSGNLAKVERIAANEYALWTRHDCQGLPWGNQNRSWFHFSVSGGVRGATVTLTLMNMNQQSKLYSQGMRPIVRSVPGRAGWERIKQQPVTAVVSGNLQVKWRHRFKHNDAVVYFAFCYPWSVADCQGVLTKLDARYRLPARLASWGLARGNNDNTSGGNDANNSGVADAKATPPTSQLPAQGIYYARECVTHSVQGRRIDLITITDCANLTWEREAVVPGLFPLRDAEPRCFAAAPSCQLVFLSARVHPGETPGSHSMNGALSFLLDPEDARAAALRARFVFKIIPMLNPDGVFHGCYRSDMYGMNLNRFYSDPDPVRAPSIFAARSLMLAYVSRHTAERVFYLDMHAHAAKRGCFLYGNALEHDRQVTNVAYARLASVNSAHFDFHACNFSSSNMSARDRRDGLSKEGCGRVALYRATGILHSYTLECNYNTGRMQNAVPSASGDGGRASPAVQQGPAPRYTPAIWESVGSELMVSLLDLHRVNPWSRLPSSEFRSLGGLRRWVSAYVKTAPQFQAKAAEAVPPTGHTPALLPSVSPGGQSTPRLAHACSTDSLVSVSSSAGGAGAAVSPEDEAEVRAEVARIEALLEEMMQHALAERNATASSSAGAETADAAAEHVVVDASSTDAASTEPASASASAAAVVARRRASITAALPRPAAAAAAAIDGSADATPSGTTARRTAVPLADPVVKAAAQQSSRTVFVRSTLSSAAKALPPRRQASHVPQPLMQPRTRARPVASSASASSSPRAHVSTSRRRVKS